MHRFEDFRTHTEQDLLDSLPRTITRLAPPALLTQELHEGGGFRIDEIANAEHIHVAAGKMFLEMLRGYRGEYDDEGAWCSKFVINVHTAVLEACLGDQNISPARRRDAAYFRTYGQDFEFVDSLRGALMSGSLWEFGYIKTLEDGSCVTYTHSLPWFDTERRERIWKFLSGEPLSIGNSWLRDEFRRVLNGNSPLPPLPPDYKALPAHSAYVQYVEMMSNLAAAFPPTEELYGARVYGREKFSKQMTELPEFKAFVTRGDQINGLYGYFALAQAGALPGSIDLRFHFSTLQEEKSASL